MSLWSVKKNFASEGSNVQINCFCFNAAFIRNVWIEWKLVAILFFPKLVRIIYTVVLRVNLLWNNFRAHAKIYCWMWRVTQQKT
jgi:ABC-type multidrug transport system fused ATPase/permease subunit